MSAPPRSGRTLLASALVAAGALWLLVQVGYVPSALLAVMATWWPVFLIGGGLDMAFPGLRPAKVPFTALASLLVIGLALFGVTLATAAETQHVLDRNPAVRSAAITLELGSAPTTIGRADGTSLLTARFNGQPQGEITSQVGAVSAIAIRPLPSTTVPFLGRGRWTVGLPTGLPVDLNIASHSAASTVDLTGVSLRELVIDAGSGRLSADLPGMGTVYRADVAGGSGHIVVRVAPGASVDLDARFRSGSAEVFVGEGTDMRLTLRTGSGPVTLDLPDTAPIRLSIADDGSGRVVVPVFLVRRSGSGDTGVWESRNLDQGGRVIEVSIAGAGSGAITVR